MRYYFASRYSRNAELREYRDELVNQVPGAVVTSRWIDCHEDIVGGLNESFTPEVLSADPDRCWQYGLHDLEDLEEADVIVSFTGPGGKGGRHIEHGYGIALADSPGSCFRLIVIGSRENIFHCHPVTEVYATWQEFLAAERERT